MTIHPFIQDKCRPDLISDGVMELLAGGEALDRQRESIELALEALRPPRETPSGTAADVVLSVLNARKKQGEHTP